MTASITERELHSSEMLHLLGRAIADDVIGHVWVLSKNALARTNTDALIRFMTDDFGKHRLFICHKNGVAYGFIGALHLDSKIGEASILAWFSPKFRRTNILARNWIEFLSIQKKDGICILNAKVKATNKASNKLVQKLSFRKVTMPAHDYLASQQIFYTRTTQYTELELKYYDRWIN